jgi:hypothetical protein
MNKDDYKAMFAQVQSVHSADPNKLEVLMNNKSTHKIHSKPLIVALAILLVAALSFGAYAIVTLLSPAQVARELGHDALAAAFEDGRGALINETVRSEGYIFTLMGMTAGKNLSDYLDADAARTFLVVSVHREDGQPVGVSPEKGLPFASGVFFSGFKPWQMSSFMLGSGGSAFDRDGVLYLVFGIDENIEMLADHTVSFAIWDVELGFAPSAEVITMLDDGTITFVDGLQKGRAMFALPLDASRADPARVAQILEELENPQTDGYEIEYGANGDSPMEWEPIEN